jgi:hypothetical protein
MMARPRETSMTEITREQAEPSDPSPGYDFGGARFNLNDPRDREIVCFILSQALYGEATGVYCGKSLYAAESLEAAQFYVRQARQELAHLRLFATIFRDLGLTPVPGHWALKLLSSHNNYYPLKVLMEHAVGEGMVLDVFKDVLLQTLPDDDPRMAGVKKKLEVICREEEEHVAWGEKETLRLLASNPGLAEGYFGLMELQLKLLTPLVARFSKGFERHPVMGQLPAFVAHVSAKVRKQGRRLGYVPERKPSRLQLYKSMGVGVGLFARSQLARSTSKLEKIYLKELGFEP